MCWLRSSTVCIDLCAGRSLLCLLARRRLAQLRQGARAQRRLTNLQKGLFEPASLHVCFYARVQAVPGVAGQLLASVNAVGARPDTLCVTQQPVVGWASRAASAGRLCALVVCANTRGARYRLATLYADALHRARRAVSVLDFSSVGLRCARDRGAIGVFRCYSINI